MWCHKSHLKSICPVVAKTCVMTFFSWFCIVKKMAKFNETGSWYMTQNDFGVYSIYIKPSNKFEVNQSTGHWNNCNEIQTGSMMNRLTDGRTEWF